MVTELWGLGPDLTPAQAVAYAGLDPAPRRSGTSVRGAEHISTTGSARLRQALFRAARSAVQHDPACRAVYDRLLARGKPKLVALVAVARTLRVVMVTLGRYKRTFARAGRPAPRPRRPEHLKARLDGLRPRSLPPQAVLADRSGELEPDLRPSAARAGGLRGA